MRAELITHRALVLLTLQAMGGEATAAEIFAKLRVRTSRLMMHECNIRSELDKLAKRGKASKHIIERYETHPDKPGGALGEKRRSFRLTDAGQADANRCRAEIMVLLEIGTTEGEAS